MVNYIHMKMVKIVRRILISCLPICVVFILASCGSTITSQPQIQTTVTINPTFQSQVSPVPTVPPYRCGAWSSNNSPGTNSTITIYARLTKDIAPVSGAIATATVHFQGFDLPLQADAPSDDGGYVTFTLSLEGRQPAQLPATVDVTFTFAPGLHGQLHCTPAFFTPQ